MLQKNPTALETHSDSEDEKQYSVQMSKNETKNKNAEEKTTDHDNVQAQTHIQTSNEGEEEDDDDDNSDKSRCHCINPLDYIDINKTKYFDATVIIFAFVNLALSIILLIRFYHNKQWAFFGVSLSLHVIAHLFYIATFYRGYKFNVTKFESRCTKKIIFGIYLTILVLVSPFINLLMYLTSAEHLILTHLLKPIVEAGSYATNNSSWFEKQSKRLGGYILTETVVTNIPNFVFQLVVIHDCIYNYNSSNYNSSMIFYLCLTFYINLFCIVVKLYVFIGIYYDTTSSTKEIFLYWVSVVADLLTVIYVIVWTYVLCTFIFCLSLHKYF